MSPYQSYKNLQPATIKYEYPYETDTDSWSRGYDVAFTRRRSPVQIRLGPPSHFLRFLSNRLVLSSHENSRSSFSATVAHVIPVRSGPSNIAQANKPFFVMMYVEPGEITGLKAWSLPVPPELQYKPDSAGGLVESIETPVHRPHLG